MTNEQNDYEYLAITEEGIIRLISLEPSPDLDAALQCSLINASLKDCDNDIVDHYVALSYVWGDASLKGSIYIDGKFLEITASLEAALRHVRDHKRVLRIWVDGICINQKDVHDRNTQVTVMGSIYSIARHTIIFLGPSNPKYKPILQMIAQGTLSEKDSMGEHVISMTEDILANPWFERVWVLQELVLSPDPWVQIGQIRMRWDLLLQNLVVKKSSTRHELLQKMARIRTKYQVRKQLGPAIDDSGSAIFSILGARKSEKASDQWGKVTILDILKARRALGVSDPRDMVYAHLGMSEPSLRSSISIDYSKSKAEVYEDVSRYIVSVSQDLSILSFVENADLETRPQFPSWVPDWSVQPEGHQFEARSTMSTAQTTGYLSWRVLSEFPGVLVFPGRYHGTVVRSISQSILPSGKGSGQKFKYTVLDWLYKPESIEVIESLLTFLAHGYESVVYGKWSKQRGEIRRKGPGVSSFPDESYSHFMEAHNKHDPSSTFHDPTIEDRHLGAISDLVGKLPASTRTDLEKKSPSPALLIHLLCRVLFDIIFYICPYLDSEDKISFVQSDMSVLMCCLPEQARLGDILASHPYHSEVFILRPDEHEGNQEYENTLKRSLANQPSKIWDDESPWVIKCCKFVTYAHLSGESRSNIFVRTWGGTGYRVGEMAGTDVIFALH